MGVKECFWQIAEVLNQIVLLYILKFPTCADPCSLKELIMLRANNTYCI